MIEGFFHIFTFGCQMNVNDSAWLARMLRQMGLEESSVEQADVIIINTCSVREKPEQKVYTALGRIRYVTRHNPRAFVAIAGCVAQQIGAGFFEKFEQVRLVVGGDGLHRAPEAIRRLFDEPELRLNLTEFVEAYPERALALPQMSEVREVEQGEPSREMGPIAYVNIMQGCDNFCAYCIVPFTRGRQKSRAPKAILEECRELLEHGVQEICLLGQNVNAYGLDKRGQGMVNQGERTSFAELLRHVAEVRSSEGRKIGRLRFVTPHPKDFSQDVIALFGEVEALCPRLHLPLQAGSDTVLSRMGRRYDMDKYLRIVEGLRKVRPDIALSTDLIVGFPGETEAQFQETLEAMKAVGFMSSFSFCYSDRPGTAASRMRDKIEPEEKADRLARLQAVQEALSRQWLDQCVHKETEVLLESVSRKQEGTSTGMESWQGRDPWGAVVNVILGEGTGYAGRLVPVRVTQAKRHSLVAVPLS